MTAKSIRLTGLAILLLVLLTVSCNGRQQQSERSIPLGGAESVRVRIEMGAGELSVGGRAKQLAEATFRYSDPSDDPVVDFSVIDAEGNLVIRQDNVLRMVNIDERNEWHIDLNEEVPLELDVSLGAGASNLKLGTLSLDRLEVNNGAGDLEIDLRGEWERDLEARIEGGIGEVTIHLPEDAGVRVNVDQGVGDVDTRGLFRDGSAYVNESYGTSEVTLDLEIDGVVGEINLYAEGE